MYNYKLQHFEPSDAEVKIGVGQFAWNFFGKIRCNGRTDNHNLQDFTLTVSNLNTNGNARKILGLNQTALTNSRAARTEISTDGKFLCNVLGLQWFLLKCDYTTKDKIGSTYSGPHSSYHRDGMTGGAPWSDETIYKQRTDFPEGDRYYLIAIDPARVYPNTAYRSNNYGSQTVRSWGFVADSMKALDTADKDVQVLLDSTGEYLTCYTSKARGLDYIMASRLWENSLQEDTAKSWVQNMFNRDIENHDLNVIAKAESKTLQISSYGNNYGEDFKNAEEILRVGHLRFKKVSDANFQKSGSSVIDLIEWYGIVPVLNVPKTVVFDCAHQYFVHHTNVVCKNCNNDNLELPRGRYVIDIDSDCLYNHGNYKYKYSRKAWILSSLANMRVTIDNDVTDRIIPISDDEVNIVGIATEDDDFLNRF
ncbi:MAG: hypothetical protein CMP53_09045 [Flavobacteriales bacterium]|nr:hypothetical protein [Flavobacteriales bacterium]